MFWGTPHWQVFKLGMQSVVMNIKQNLTNHIIWYRKSHGSKRKSGYTDHSFLLIKSTYMSCIFYSIIMKIWNFSNMLLSYKLKNTLDFMHCYTVKWFFMTSDYCRYKDTVYVKWQEHTMLKDLFMIAWQKICMEKQQFISLLKFTAVKVESSQSWSKFQRSVLPPSSGPCHLLFPRIICAVLCKK
jgi:hypothetical protein